MRRRRNRHPCVHLHISQDAISDYWKVCDKSVHNTNGINDENLDEKCTDTKRNTIKVIHQCREEIVNECNRDVKNGGKKEDISKEDSKSIEKLISLEPCTNEEDSQKTLCICANKPCSDCNISRFSPRLIAKKEENKKLEQIKKSYVSKDIYNDDIKLSSKCINEGASNTMEKQLNLCDINTIDAQSSLKKTSNKRRSQSDTSFGEMIIADNCVDSILYNELRKKCGSSVKKNLSQDYLEIDKTIELNFTPKSRLQSTQRMKSHQKLDELNKIVTDFSDDIRTFTFIQKQKDNSKHSVNNHQSTSSLQGKLPSRTFEIASGVQQKNTIPVTSYKKKVNMGKLQKFLCRNCYCNAKVDTCNDSQWNNCRKQSLPQSQSYSPSQSRYKAWSTNVQSQRSNYPCACCLKSREKTDSIIYRKISSPRETHSAKGKLQSLQCKEKPTLVIFKNRKLSRSRNSTNSPHSSSITSSGTVGKSLPNNSVNCRCPSYKASRYTIPASSGYKYSKNDTIIEPTSLFSSSSSLSRSKRCHSWIALSQNSAYSQEPISSSSCMKFQRWRRTYPEYEKRRSLYPASTSCSCSLSSMETLRDVYNLEETDCELRSRKLWRKPRLYEQKKKKMIHMDERHVRWNIKKAY
ncbi:unnamed protein product [Xylocopa violacea]|uniref:Uncharacterized protein n=1 Tax=Xylocopa violacea TaxID=135666 RepID=A0ABP1PCA5_XYLVO